MLIGSAPPEPLGAGSVGQEQERAAGDDPAHDDPAALATYQHHHGDHGAGWIAARPVSDTDLATLLRVFGVVAVPDGMGGFVHNAAIAVVAPDGRLVDILNWDDGAGAASYVTRRLAP